ncbi:MAG: type II secretion system protein N [Syntrophales bacterium]
MRVLAALPGKNSRFALRQFSRRALRSGGMVPGKISQSPLMKRHLRCLEGMGGDVPPFPRVCGDENGRNEVVDWSRFSHLSLADFRGLVSRRSVILAVMAIVLFQATGIFYKVLALQLIRMRPAPAAAEKVRTAAVPVREPADAYRVIPERNLFGTTTKAITEKQTAALPQQQDVALLIDLKGTVAGGPKYGFAIVEDKGTRKQRLVKTGDLIAGARVIRIRRNAIDLLISGQERTLKIVETNQGAILPPPPAATAAAPAGTIVVSRSEIDAGLQDMGTMLRQAQIRPYFNAGVPEGFLISNIRPGSLYQKMGAADGDIIQEVNGRPIRTADDVMGLLNTIKAGSSMSMTIKRRGRQETLNYQFR